MKEVNTKSKEGAEAIEPVEFVKDFHALGSACNEFEMES